MKLINFVLHPSDFWRLAPLIVGIVAVTLGCSHQSIEGPTAAAQTKEEADTEPASLTKKYTEPMPKSWRSFRGTATNTGFVPATLSDELELLWSHELEKSSFGSSVVIDDAMVYSVDLDGVVFANLLSDGAVAWKYETEGFVDAPPAIQDGLLYVADLDGKITCIDVKTQKPVWENETETTFSSTVNFYDGKLVAVAETGEIFILNQKTGEEIRKIQIDDQIRSAPSIIDARCFLTGCNSELYKINLESGEMEGSLELAAQCGITAALQNDNAYFIISGGTLYNADWKENKTEWTWENERGTQEPKSSPAITKDVIVFGGGASRKVHAVNAATGKTRWEFSTKRSVNGSPIIVGNRVYVGTDSGRVYALNLDNGKVVWEYECGGHLIGSIAAASDRLVVTNDRGGMFCFGKKEK